MPKRVMMGTVVSDKTDKTVVVLVERRVKHPLYGKIIKRSKKYHAHDEGNEFKAGETVRIEETAPISKLKTWKVVERVDTHATPEKGDKKPAKAKKDDLTVKTDDQLATQLSDLKREQFNLRFQSATNQLEKPSRVKEVRRTIARIKTIQTTRARDAASAQA